MRRSTGAAVSVPLAVLIAGCGGLPRPMAGTLRPPSSPRVAAPIRDESPTTPDPVAEGLLEHHNRIRLERDLPALEIDPRLTEAAREQVSGMIALGKIRHKGADGSTPADRVRRQGVAFINVGENVAAGQETTAEVMDGWMDSPGHRKNILGDFERMGASRDEDDAGRPYWCVVFATPLPRLEPARAAAELASLINELRSNESLPPLQPDESLMGVARDHARALAEAGSIDPPGAPIADALKEADIPYRRISSAVASGSPGPSEVLDSLSGDPRRRRDLLGEFDRVGVGYALGGDGRPYWCVILLDRPS
jgi:uncharacterized protein YkwD